MRDAVAAIPAVLTELQSTTDDIPVHTTDEQDVRSYRQLMDINGDPLGVLVSSTAREVTMLGQEAANLALQLFVAMALVLLGLTWLIIRKDIVGRLERLAAHMAGIRRSGDLSARIAPDRDDEIGRLGQAFNALTEELQQVRRQLVEQSFRAGRADTATDVLHNVRNAMTPVVNVTENLSGALQEINALRLARAAEELADPACPEDRRKALLQYMHAAAARISGAGSDATDDVNLISRQLRLVEDILTGQEKVARFQPLQERLDLAELVSEAAAILPATRHTGIDLHIAPALADTFVMANRVHLLQILGNVMLNAFESVERAGRPRAHIAVNATTERDGDAAFVRLSISDNGAGVDPAHITQIFQRGFTSKTVPGHGMGLHWCANAVGAIGGAIEIESDGAGTGATVHIRLPAVAAPDLADDVTLAAS
ncbi:MAG: HAMP domain-containing sensor histidine kinase [Woeseiaceae bacterium]|nr:HAMP domain-containing sensor histidine kinase [Woeseiaceae bacterium]